MKTLIISNEDICEVIRQTGLNSLMDLLIERLKTAFQTYDREQTIIPHRDGFEYTVPHPGLLEWMPAMQLGEKATIKIVSYNPSSPEQRGVPTIISALTAFDAATGNLKVLADGTFLTALRTGAASAIASEIMAHPESKVLGLIGCGAQSITQLHALSRVFDLETVLIHDTDGDALASFRQRASFIDVEIEKVKPKEVVARSDIITTATSVEKEEGPVFQDSVCKPWLHINAVGSDFPGKFELPLSLLKRSFISPDFLQQAIEEGECQNLDPSEIGPDIVSLVKSRSQYKGIRNRLTVFDSTGWALEDQVALDMLVELSKEKGLGNMVQIASRTEDPKNPYSFAGRDGESFDQRDARIVAY